MILKFLKLRSGDPRVALAYVDGGLDPEHERDEVRLIDGSPEEFLRVAATLTFSETYKSCVMSWSRGDAPSEDQLEQAIDGFKTVAFAGMEWHRFAHCAFLHRKEDKVDLHILIASVDLETGKHFNPAPPKWELAFDPLRDMLNARFGWSSPKDSALARPIRPVYGVHHPAESVRTLMPGASADAANTIQEDMLALVIHGVIKDRADLVRELQKRGEVPRANGKDYVSFKPKGFEKAFRLRGLIFQKDFHPGMLTVLAPTPRPVRTSADHERDKDPVEEAAAKTLFDAAVKRRAVDNYGRYLAPRQRASKKTVAVKGAECLDLPPIDLAAPARTQAPADPGGFLQEAAVVTSEPLTQSPDPRLTPWTDFLKQPTQTYQDEHEPEIETAASGLVGDLVEVLRRQFGKLATTIERLGRTAQILAGRIVRRRNAERARGALEAVELHDARRGGRPENG